MITIVDKLNRLADMQAQQDAIRMHFDELRTKILTPEIRAQLAEIDAEQQTALDAAGEGIQRLQDEIKVEVIKAGLSAKGAYLQAVYSKPRITWDSKGLEGFAVAHPEIGAFRRVGEPSVSFRGVK